MLTPDYLDVLPNGIVDLYEEYTQTVINDIARRLGRMAFESAAWQVQRLSESGALYEDILDQLSELTGQSESELRNIFRRAGVRSMNFDDALYRAAGMDPLPLNMSPAMIEVLRAGLIKTGGVIRNLTMTTALSGQQAFERAADLAYLQISTGTYSYDQAIRQAVKKVANDGLSVVHFTGRTDQLDVAVRRTVLTGVGQTVGKLQIARADEMGVDLVQTTAHGGARPTHQIWQGKIFSRSGLDKKYPPLVESTGYGSVTGLMGANCRHNMYPFFPGLSENAYDKATLNEMNNKTVQYRGKELPYYDATQIQRELERRVRYFKRQASALEAAGLPVSSETEKIREYQAKLRAFVKETKIPRQYVREQI